MSRNSNGNRESNLQGLHGKILEELGRALVSGDLSEGAVVKIEDLQGRFGASRTVVRECVRVLESMGLLLSKRHVGVAVLSASAWNLYDPYVIRWRLASNARVAQLRSLTELRMAVEPEAARLAAMRAPAAGAGELVALAGGLWAAAESGDMQKFLKVDTEFHSILLAISGNEMFAQLDGLVAVGLAGRTNYGLMPPSPHSEALQMHLDVALAIQSGDFVTAQQSMLVIMHRAMEEMSGLWE